MLDQFDELLRRLRLLERINVLHVGTIPAEAIAHWEIRVTEDVIITGERRLHYLERHPEILSEEPLLLRALVNPEEIHSNAVDQRIAIIDQRIAIIYQQIGEHYALRIPVWISDREDRQNSVLSMRRARRSEIERGRQLGRMVWRK